MTSRRGKRPFGVRQQDWLAMKQWEASKKEIIGIRFPPMLVPVACRCSKYGFAHLHAQDRRKWEEIKEVG